MFVFKMQAVLDAKKNREEQALAAFKERLLVLDQEKGKLAAMTEQKEALLTALRRGKYTTIRSGDMDLQVSFLRQWERRITQQRALILHVAQEVEKHRQALMEIMKDRKILENLRDRQLEEYRQHRQAQERLEADEIAVLRHERKKP